MSLSVAETLKINEPNDADSDIEMLYESWGNSGAQSFTSVTIKLTNTSADTPDTLSVALTVNV